MAKKVSTLTAMVGKAPTKKVAAKKTAKKACPTCGKC